MGNLNKGRSRQFRHRYALFGACIAAALILIRFDLVGASLRWAADRGSWLVNDALAVLFAFGAGAMIFLVRNRRDMQREIAQSKAEKRAAGAFEWKDALTGLSNRRRFSDELRTEVSRVIDHGGECAVCLLDLDHFKLVNDRHGHPMGDRVLIEVAKRLREIAGAGVPVARLGGDEFACLLTFPEGSDAADRVAGRIRRAMQRPMLIADIPIDASASIGIARCPVDATDPGQLLRCAGIALVEGKRRGRDCQQFFEPAMDNRVKERARLEAEFRAGLTGGEVHPYFQPVIGLGDTEISGFEALARWEHPIRGLISPDTFIPIAEDLGLMDQLTFRVLHEGCLAARAWPGHVTLSINISPSQLKSQWLTARLLAILTETGFQPGRLIVEVTESAVIDDLDQAADVFASLHNAGVRIALDDFGKGYSSLHHLRQLRFDVLKIDSSFVLSMQSAESEKIVRAITSLGKSLGLPVTAEGVESEDSAQALRSLGCEQAQGFLFGVPLPAAATATLFARPPSEARRATG